MIGQNHTCLRRFLRRSLLYLPVIFLIPVLCKGQSNTANKLTLLFIGDIMGHSEQIWSAEDREKHIYNYDTVFTYIKPVIAEADIAIANFEVTLAGPPYSGYPAFVSPAAFAVACKNAGIDCLVQANNHSADRGAKGIKKTINILDSLEIMHTGTFSDLNEREKRYPFFFEKNGISLALLNYSYGTNGITVRQPAILNTIDREIIAEDIEKAIFNKPDIIIVFLHWGKEYDTSPSKSQYDLADYLFDNGVDIVIGAHPHVLQKMVWNSNINDGKGTIAVYSLGNFISNQRKHRTDGGAMARIEITKTGSGVKITDADYYLTWVYTPIEKYRKRFFVIPCSEFENKQNFFSDSSAYPRMKRFMSDSRSLLYKQNDKVYEMIFNGSSWLLNF
ncbi:MAG TPA: CapA family protein [Bacteroidales bacterium]|nr:CapA family protein [Bacteroidales bacterium]